MFKWIILGLMLIGILGCESRAQETFNNPPITWVYDGSLLNIMKFKDGDVTCYVAGSDGVSISCIRDIIKIK